jgi:hypothetical protein
VVLRAIDAFVGPFGMLWLAKITIFLQIKEMAATPDFRTSTIASLIELHYSQQFQRFRWLTQATGQEMSKKDFRQTHK